MLLRLVALLFGFEVAQFADINKFGLLIYWSLSQTSQFWLALIILGCAIYWQHRIFHKSPILWRLHRVHNSDIEYNASTGLRFHPIEIILSFFIILLMVRLISVSFYTLIVFEIIFNHSIINNTKANWPNFKKIYCNSKYAQSVLFGFTSRVQSKFWLQYFTLVLHFLFIFGTTINQCKLSLKHLEKIVSKPYLPYSNNLY